MNDIEKAIEQLKHDKENFEALLKEYKPSTIKERVESIIKSHILAIQALEKQLNGGWISVKEKLPKRIFEDCLVTTEKGEIYTSKFYGHGEEFQGHKEYPEGVWQIDQYDETVIAWQPLPEPYKEVEQ